MTLVHQIIPAEFTEFLTYWHSLPKVEGQGIPLKADFNPASVIHMLPSIFLMDALEESDLNIRLAGTKIEELLPIQLQNKKWRELFDNEAEYMVKDLTNMIFNQKVGLFVVREIHMGNVVEYLKSILLPFLGPQHDMQFIIGLSNAEDVLKRNYNQTANLQVTNHKVVYSETVDIGFGKLDWRYQVDGIPQQLQSA